MKLQAGFIAKSGRVTRRLPSSINGNPRFQVTFADGDTYPTGVDANVAHRIENSDYDGAVQIRLSKGEIVDIQPLDAE